MNIRDIEEAIQNAPDRYGDTGWSSWHWADGADNIRLLPGIGSARVVEQVGGEGQGDSARLVFELAFLQVGPLRYYELDGYYASYDGFTWDGDLYEAKPVEKTITVYEKVEN